MIDAAYRLSSAAEQTGTAFATAKGVTVCTVRWNDELGGTFTALP